MECDVFISHASEDNRTVAGPLANILRSNGLKVLIDETDHLADESIANHIHTAINKARYGVVLLSKAYINKTKNEFAAFFSLENMNSKILLPVRHEVELKDLSLFSPMLAERICVSTDEGLEHVANKIVKVVKHNSAAKYFWDVKPIVLGISGGSCSGKTWVANKLIQMYPSAITVFDLDGYYKNFDFVDTLEYRHDNPEALDFDSAIADIISLKNGIQTDIPLYDFETHRQIGHRKCSPSPIVLVEGLFAFANTRFRQELDIKIWIAAGNNRRLERRFLRDTKERGRDAEEVFERYANDVEPSFEKYIQPMQSFADAVFINDGRDEGEQPTIISMITAYIEKRMNSMAIG